MNILAWVSGWRASRLWGARLTRFCTWCQAYHICYTAADCTSLTKSLIYANPEYRRLKKRVLQLQLLYTNYHCTRSALLLATNELMSVILLWFQVRLPAKPCRQNSGTFPRMIAYSRHRVGAILTYRSSPISCLQRT